MRIGVFHTSLPERDRKVGGVEVFVHRLANHLADREHDVTLFSFARTPPRDARYAMRRIGRPGLGAPIPRMTICPVLLNRVDWSGLDVLSLHGDDWFFVHRSIPTVRTFHGSALYEARSATSSRRTLAQLMAFPAEVAASHLADHSYTAAAGMPRAYRIDGTLPLAVDRSELGEGGSAERSRHPSLLFVGTWEGRKRGRFLRDLFVRDVLPSVPGAELWMVSDRCEEGPSIRWVRYPSDDELRTLYRQAWVFCLPSTYEGFGIPYLEAMVHGTAVVASPNPGAEWVTDGGRCGGLAPDGSLAELLVTFLTNAEVRARFVTAGHRRARDFTWERTCLAHERAFVRSIATFEGRFGGRAPKCAQRRPSPG